MAACSDRPPDTSDALTVLLPREAEQLDPRFVADPYGLKVSRLLFGSLVTIDPRTLEVVPDLAESIAQPSETEFVVTLREGLRFSDGSTLDARDVVATFEGIVDPALGSLYAGTYRRIAEVRAIDARHVRFTLDAPHATFLTDLEVPIVRAEDAHRRIAELDGPPPIGAGPYVVRSRSAGRIRLEANPHWYGGVPLHPRVLLLVVRDDNTRALRLTAGAGDVAINAIPSLLIPMFEEDPRFEVRSAPGVGTTYLGFNMDAGPLADVRVRTAIAMAIDRATLIATELGGRGEIANSWIPAGHWADVEVDPLPFEPERARQLLRDAGATNLVLTLRTPTDRGRLSIARAIAGMLREVGVEVRVRPSETATLIADLNAGRFDLTLLQVPEVFEPHLLDWFFDSARIPEHGQRGANRWRLRDAAVDAALERGRAHSAIEARRAAYAEVLARLSAELPVFPLWHDDTVVVARRGIVIDVPRDGRLGVLAR